MTVMTWKRECRRVVVRMLRRAPGADHVQLRFRLLRRDAGPQVRLERAKPSRRPRIVAAGDRGGQPQIGDVPLEPRRHDADDRPRLAVEHQRAADHAGVCAEQRHPRAVVHHGDRRRARRRVRRAERSAEQRLHAEEVEAVRRHPGDVRRSAPCVADPVHRSDGWCRRRLRTPSSAPGSRGTPARGSTGRG